MEIKSPETQSYLKSIKDSHPEDFEYLKNITSQELFRKPKTQHVDLPESWSLEQKRRVKEEMCKLGYKPQCRSPFRFNPPPKNRFLKPLLQQFEAFDAEAVRPSPTIDSLTEQLQSKLNFVPHVEGERNESAQQSEEPSTPKNKIRPAFVRSKNSHPFSLDTPSLLSPDTPSKSTHKLIMVQIDKICLDNVSSNLSIRLNMIKKELCIVASFDNGSFHVFDPIMTVLLHHQTKNITYSFPTMTFGFWKS